MSKKTKKELEDYKQAVIAYRLEQLAVFEREITFQIKRLKSKPEHLLSTSFYGGITIGDAGNSVSGGGGIPPKPHIEALLEDK
jgi:hypothetical protein